ncbi:Stage III sporulation protein AB [bioreactor metagenome]|uniref:Stage III sporulation protein AB n=1 Tax=bioreactor metagenome TaxID=1076179 RepID=A0A644UZ38_9ZZZZ|nr:stage III sporulation protein AB [Negativicutes bacterium]
MWLKMLGGIIIIASGTSIGFLYANRCCERPRQIRQIISCIGSLKSYISYVSLPLAEALINCTNGTCGAVKELFQKTATILKGNGWMTPQEALQQAISETHDLVLEKPEIEVLVVFGANLGSTSRDEQTNYLDMVQEQLAKIECDALKLRDQNSKMYRYLGVCGGLAVVIVLI